MWAAAFVWWFQDDPHIHPSVTPAERALIGVEPPPVGHPGIPWAAAAGNRTLWLLGTIMICGAFNGYLYNSWYPTYLQKARGVDPQTAGWLASMVLGAGAVGTLGSGLLVDWVTRHASNPVRGRRLIGVAAYGTAACWLVLAMNADSPYLSAGLTAVSCLFMYCQQSGWWSSIVDISGRHVGALFGLANGVGVFGAMSSQFLFGAFADWRKDLGYVGRDQWDPAFYIYLGALVTAATCWAFVDPTRPVVPADEAKAE